MKQLRICYHGTSTRKVADKILKEGFKDNTYFSKNLHDAISYGGRYVFSVVFETDLLPDGWQFVANKMPPESIMGLTHYREVKKLYENKPLGKKVFESNIEAERRGN